MWKNETLEGGEKAEERSETSVFNKVLFDLISFYYSLTSRYLCTHCQAHTHTHARIHKAAEITLDHHMIAGISLTLASFIIYSSAG